MRERIRRDCAAKLRWRRAWAVRGRGVIPWLNRSGESIDRRRNAGHLGFAQRIFSEKSPGGGGIANRGQLRSVASPLCKLSVRHGTGPDSPGRVNLFWPVCGSAEGTEEKGRNDGRPGSESGYRSRFSLPSEHVLQLGTRPVRPANQGLPRDCNGPRNEVRQDASAAGIIYFGFSVIGILPKIRNGVFFRCRITRHRTRTLGHSARCDTLRGVAEGFLLNKRGLF